MLATFLVRARDQETHRFGPGPATAMRRLAPVSPRATRRIG
jgi:hypothetical protein